MSLLMMLWSPLDAIVAGHPDFSAVRQVGQPDGTADGGIFRGGIAVMGRHRPSCGVLENGAQLLMLILESGLFHWILALCSQPSAFSSERTGDC
jgi:hypothetical protein